MNPDIIDPGYLTINGEGGVLHDPLPRVAHTLLMNPWSSFVFLCALTGLKEWQLREALANNSLIDRVAFPVHPKLIKGHNKLTMYNLTSQGARQLASRFQSIGKNITGLALCYYRLTRVRQIVIQLKEAGLLSWVVSPWWPGRLDAPIDALICVQPEAGAAVFPFALLVAPPSACSAWYLDQLRNWRRARSRHARLKAVQLLLLSEASEHPLNKDQIAAQDDNVCFLADGHDVKRDILGQTRMVSHSSEKAPRYIPEHFLHRMPHNPVKGYRELKTWLGEDQSARAHILRKCMTLTAREIDMLWMIARYPAVNLQEMTAAGMIDSGARNQRRLLNSLLANNIIIAINELPHAYCISEVGLQVVAALHGVGADFMNAYLGNPLREGMFVHQNEHNRSVQQFMFSLSRTSELVDWHYMTPRYEFANICIPGRKVGERRIVYPDSTATIKSRTGESLQFWLELDRATRRGRKRIQVQIEKYFAIHYARHSEIPIPPLLYVVATEQSSETTRLRQVIDCFKDLSATRFPSNQLVALFAAGKTLAQYESEIMHAPLWLLYFQGRVAGNLVSLEEGLLRAHRLQHSTRPLDLDYVL
ncbi:MAG: hypothetical protein DWQ07_17880 [Chloroflexi bacterium]|nr:MAG: hypothetical protein DWQ07_17880 [Chloroflexota bacterium]